MSRNGGSSGKAGLVDILRRAERPFVDSADRRARVEVAQNVPSGLKGDQVRVGRHRRHPTSCCARRGVSVLHGHGHSRTAAGADQACTWPPPRNPRQSPRFRVNQAQDLEVCIQLSLALVAVVEVVIQCEPAKTRQYVVDAFVVEIRTLNRKDGYRREFRWGRASQRERSPRLGVPMSR